MKTNDTSISRFVVKEVVTNQELQELYTLRNTVYNNSRLSAAVQHENCQEYDIFDNSSHHLGLYVVSNNNEKLIGCMRLTPAQHSKPMLPILEYGLDNKLLKDFINKSQRLNKSVVEAGRIAIDPEWQNQNIFRPFVEAAAAYCFFIKKYDLCLGATFPFFVRTYRNVGFKKIPKTKNQFSTPIGHVACCIFTTLSNMNYTMLEKLDKLTGDYKKTGEISFYTSLKQSNSQSVHHKINQHSLSQRVSA